MPPPPPLPLRRHSASATTRPPRRESYRLSKWAALRSLLVTAKEIAGGMCLLHSYKIIHGDLSGVWHWSICRCRGLVGGWVGSSGAKQAGQEATQPSAVTQHPPAVPPLHAVPFVAV